MTNLGPVAVALIIVHLRGHASGYQGFESSGVPGGMFDKTIPFDPMVEMMVTEEEGSQPVRWETETSFTLSWAARGWGFGTVGFSKLDEGGLYCGDEYMGLETATLLLARFCKTTPESEWPALLRQYGGAEQIMADVVDWESRPKDEGTPGVTTSP